MTSPFRRTELTTAVKTSLAQAFAAASVDTEPYRHWLVSEVLPDEVLTVLRDLPFPRPDLGGVSGKREIHNDQRQYFDAFNNARYPACGALAEAFQSPEVARAIEAACGADLAGAFVRLEYAQDVDGFWLEPHTDLGVKKFTMLLYLPDSADQADLGTDLYADQRTWSKRPPFLDNTALVFVPGSDTWHGLERRPIAGVRKSVIMNYVTDDWLARDQLAFPTTPVRV